MFNLNTQRKILNLQEDQSLIDPHKIEPYIVRISQSGDYKLIRGLPLKKAELPIANQFESGPWYAIAVDLSMHLVL